MMKRNTAIILSIIMLFSIFSIIGMAEDNAPETVTEIEMGSTDIRLPAVEGTENLLKNGDLEELDANGKPENWGCQAFGREDGVGSSIITGADAYEGNSIKLVGGPAPANLPFITQRFETQGGAIYQLRTMLRKDSGSSNMTVKLEFYPEKLPGATTVWEVNTFSISTTNGRWQETLYNFKAPITAKSVVIYLRIMNSNGEICYYDDASVHMVRPAEMLDVSPDQYFYYPEAEKGEVTVTALTQFYPEAIGGSVDFTFMDGEQVLLSDTATLDANGKAVFGYDTKLLKDLKKEYVLRAVLKDKNGNELFTKEETIYKYERPKYIREDGVYQVPGEEPFNVIPTYHAYQVNTADEFEELRNAGINVLQGNEYMLERAGNAGMKVLITLYDNRLSAGHADMREHTIELVTKYKDDPRVYGWAVSDEPYLNLADPLPELKEAYKLIRDIDDNHPVYIVECVSKHLTDTAKVCDIVAHDPYLGATQGYSGVKMNTSSIYNAALKTVAAADGIKPTLHLLQAFENVDYIPDADAMRHMIYQSYMAGIMAHGYYSWDDAMVRDGKSIRLSEVAETNIYEGITTFAAKEQEDVFRHFVTKEYPGFSHYVGKDVMYHGYIKNNKLYMIVMNQSTEAETEFAIPLTSFDGSVSIEGYRASYVSGKSGGSFEKSTGTLEVSVPKHGVVVMEIIPEEAVDFGVMSEEKFWNHFKEMNGLEKVSDEVSENGKNWVKNPGVEILADNRPDGYEISTNGGSASFAVERDTGKTHDGSTAALALSGVAAGDTMTVSKTVTLPAGKLDVTAFMNLTSFTSGSGVKLELLNSDGTTSCVSTDWFVKTAYNDSTPMGWRKMMVCYTNTAERDFIIRVTFAGTGTVYVDDFAAVVTTDFIRNGDFEGFAGDYKPAGAEGTWSNTNGDWAEGNFASVLMEPDGNHYLYLNAPALSEQNKFVAHVVNYNSENNVAHLPGKRVTLQLDYLGGGYGPRVCLDGLEVPSGMYTSSKQTMGATGGEWRRGYSMHYTIPAGIPSNTIIFYIYGADETGKIDNLRLNMAEDKLTISEADGVVKADFVAFGTDYSVEANYREATVIVARYRVYEGNKLSLDAVEIGSDKAERVAIQEGTSSPNPDDVGETPLRASASLEKPTDDGTYVYKTFAWDGIGHMRPQVAAKTLS